MVIFPKDQEWVEVLRHELLRFDGGTFDDIVDAMAWQARLAMSQAPPSIPKKKRLKSWKDKLPQFVGGTANAEKHPMCA